MSSNPVLGLCLPGDKAVCVVHQTILYITIDKLTAATGSFEIYFFQKDGPILCRLAFLGASQHRESPGECGFTSLHRLTIIMSQVLI